MSRGRYPPRLVLPELDPGAAGRYRLVWESRDLYHRPESFPPLTAEALFEAPGPLAIDFGCATGEFLRALAAREPEARFLGVDCARKPIDYAAAQAAALGIPNLRFIHADVMLLAPLLRPASVERAFVHFPVPVQISRRRKHQLYAPPTLDHIQRALVPGGRLSVITDEPSVAAEVELILGRHAGFRSLPPDAWRLAMDDGLKSPFHRRWEARGRAIRRWELEKTGG